ncbi:hypothetical protein BLNAU_20831 [Blattamonas nauphoetae]|uniref:Uncharacterized protein n=1 Tax=Blattamonas nauphoetae TaxID=2049346 RepID=A0ABQ9WXI3_9EUKA|nr:hypothetical protein BLNAU_20831 [Blattamonas nauphoetae]
MVRLALVQADLIPQIIINLNPQSLSFVEAVDIHINVMQILTNSVWLSTPSSLAELGIEDGTEQQDVHEAVLQQVVVPSEKYILHLCVNRYSIIDGELSMEFMELLTRLLEICPYYQQTMDFVLNMSVFLTIPSCLTIIECTTSICNFLDGMNDIQREWNRRREKVREMGKKVRRMLRMEGIEDVTEEKLRNDNSLYGGVIVADLIDWNNLLGMNFPQWPSKQTRTSDSLEPFLSSFGQFYFFTLRL